MQPKIFLENYQGFEGGTIAKAALDEVWLYYGDKDSHTLSTLTQLTDPWINPRRGLPAGERGHQGITHKAMMYYYQNLN